MSLSPLVGVPSLVLFAMLWASMVVVGVLRARNRRWVWLSALRRSLLGIVLFAALLGPVVQVEREDMATNTEILLVVDRTGSMAAEDVEGGPRLGAVSRDIMALLEATPGSRYSIVTWDGSARTELPLTTDTSAVASFAELLHQEISEFSAGSSLNRPLDDVLDILESSHELRPGNARYLIVISDGEATDPSDAEVSSTWQEVAPLVDGGAIWGFGTPEGGPMQTYQVGVGPTGEYIEDPDSPGQNAISRIDQHALQQLADYTQLPLTINPSEQQVAELGSQILDGAESVATRSRNNWSYNYVIWPLGIAAAVLIGWECISFAGTAATWRRRHAV